MSAILGRTVFQRRGLDVHIANLFALRRKHRDSSFFAPSGAIRDYARDYLRTWIPVWESDAARERANAELDAMLKNTLGLVPERQADDDPEERLFREVLGILQEDYPRYYSGDGDDGWEAQRDELTAAYYPIDDPLPSVDRDDSAFANVLPFGTPDGG